jgi:hypothetical protein
MTHTDTHATPTRTLLSCPVCGAREQLSRPYLPDEALHGRQIVPYSIMRHAILQYFAWHPSYTTAFMITVWLEGTDSEVWCNPALLRRIQRTLREMVAADDVRQMRDEASDADGNPIHVMHYRKRLPEERSLRPREPVAALVK